MGEQKTSAEIKNVYLALYRRQGAQGWWPAESKFEIMVGAVLTQNTAWTNVEKAIRSLKGRHLLQPHAILDCDPSVLAHHIRSSGTFNIKAKRLRALCEWYVSHGEYKAISNWSTSALRSSLLAVHGIGPETADAIILYAFKRPVFVVDAYTKRIFERLGLVARDSNYETLRAYFKSNLEIDVTLFGEYHALIVEHAKRICKVQPKCRECILRNDCLYNLKECAAPA